MRKNPFAKIYHLVKGIWGTAEKLWAAFAILLWFCQCSLESCYWGAEVWMLKSALTLLQTTGFLPSGALQGEDAARGATVEGSLCGWVFGGALCLGQCRTVTWITVTPLNMFLKMQFSLEFLDVWGFLDRMKRNFSLCDFEPTLIDASSFMFCQFFWEAQLA